MDLEKAIQTLEALVANPSEGLPEEVFYYISRTTPLVNVDLLIQDEDNRTLLAWRDDACCGRGWHIPGGIVRFKEKMKDRIQQVALTEIGRPVEFDASPIHVAECIREGQRDRGHFISFLYRCHLPGSFRPTNAGLEPDDPGFLRWHQGCPENLLAVQRFYASFIDHNSSRGETT